MDEPATDGEDLRDLAETPAPGLIAELWHFMRSNKKWWLIPIVAMLLLVGGFIMLTGTAAGTFIYTLF